MPASQIFSGTGDPNGVFAGNPGDVYQDQTGQLWVNTAAPSIWTLLGVGSSARSRVVAQGRFDMSSVVTPVMTHGYGFGALAFQGDTGSYLLYEFKFSDPAITTADDVARCQVTVSTTHATILGQGVADHTGDPTDPAAYLMFTDIESGGPLSPTLTSIWVCVEFFEDDVP